MRLVVEQCPFWLAGLLLGGLVVAMRWAGNLHLGALGSFVAAQSWARRPRRAPDWRVFFLVGMMGGGMIYGAVAGDLTFTFANGSFDALFGGVLFGSPLAAKALVLAAAGTLIGFGARVAGGCTSGHGICGMAQLSPGSAAATATFVLTAIVVANVVPALAGAAR
jgi:uncharacterized membrane protein YedE/YeeE